MNKKFIFKPEDFENLRVTKDNLVSEVAANLANEKLMPLIEWDTSKMISAETNLGKLQTEIDKLRAENAELNNKLNWLVTHAIDCAAISKAKGAELLGVPLIDFVYEDKVSALEAENAELKEANRDCIKTINERGLCIDVHQAEIANLRADKYELRDTLRRFEHECETIQEMKTKLTAADKQMEIMAEALKFECGNRCAYQNPCNARESLAQYEKFKKEFLNESRG